MSTQPRAVSTKQRILRADTHLNEAIAEIKDLTDPQRKNLTNSTQIYALNLILGRIRDARAELLKLWPPQ